MMNSSYVTVVLGALSSRYLSFFGIKWVTVVRVMKGAHDLFTSDLDGRNGDY